VAVPVASLGLSGHAAKSRASAGEPRKLASSDDFARWEAQLAATANCANPVRLRGRIDAIDRTPGSFVAIYDTTYEPGGVVRIPWGNRRAHLPGLFGGVQGRRAADHPVRADRRQGHPRVGRYPSLRVRHSDRTQVRPGAHHPYQPPRPRPLAIFRLGPSAMFAQVNGWRAWRDSNPRPAA
jgi:hypothetical protein